MTSILHITDGDCAGNLLEKSGIPGEVLVWRDVLYDGPRNIGWPTQQTLEKRAFFLEANMNGEISQEEILESLKKQYRKLTQTDSYNCILLWFDACLFDQSMLVHILNCLKLRAAKQVELICPDSFPGIEPFHGLGQLQPIQFVSLYPTRIAVTGEQFRFAATVDNAFAEKNIQQLRELSNMTNAPLPSVPAAARRWLEEQPNPVTGLGKLETLALEAIKNGCDTPKKIYSYVADADTPPQYWGDTTLWAKINDLVERGLISIKGPNNKLPLSGNSDLKNFTDIRPVN